MKCGGNADYTINVPTSLDTSAERYKEQYINNNLVLTFTDFVNTVPSGCPFSAYKIYSDASGNSEGVSGVSFTTNA